MEPNYARLCASFVAARALLRGRVDLADFEPAALADDASLELASRITIAQDDNPDPNALVPITVTIELSDGSELQRQLHVIYGNPANPMQRTAYLEKFNTNLSVSRDALSGDAAAKATLALETLEEQDDFAAILDLLCAH
jgi:2-methylcitrate dehydratase PrpD